MTIDDLFSQVTAAIANVPTESVRAQMAAEANILLGRHNAQGASAEDQQEARARLMQLQRDAEIASRLSLWSTFSMIFVTLIAAAYFIGIYVYLRGLGSPQYAAVEATRAVLVFTLSVAMLGYGGLLIVRPLFSSMAAAEMQERFRLAREIFMVFAGVFGTIIGFYFGTTTPTTAADPPELGTPSFAQGKVSVAVDGGRAPFSGRFMLTSGGGGVPMEIVGRTLSYAVPQGDCPAGATIEVTDGDNRRDTAALACPDDGEGDNETAPANNSSTTNGVVGNET